MRTFSLYITDKRYSAPTLAFVTVRDVDRARQLAVERLEESENHLSAELWEGDERLLAIGRGEGSPPTATLAF